MGGLAGEINRLQGFLFSHKNRLLRSLTHRCDCWLQIQLYVNVNARPAGINWNKTKPENKYKKLSLTWSQGVKKPLVFKNKFRWILGLDTHI